MPGPEHPFKNKPGAAGASIGPGGTFLPGRGFQGRLQDRIAASQRRIRELERKIYQDAMKTRARTYKTDAGRKRAEAAFAKRAERLLASRDREQARVQRNRAILRVQKPRFNDLGGVASEQAFYEGKKRRKAAEAARKAAGPQSKKSGRKFSLAEAMRFIGEHDPKMGTRTPAGESSHRGDFLAGNRYYTGRSDPDRKRDGFYEWALFANKIEYHSNSMAGLMSYHLKNLLNKMRKDIEASSPGSVRGRYRSEAKRQGSDVWIMLTNDHVAFPFLLSGTASKRQIKTSEKQLIKPYPITPRSGEWNIREGTDDARSQRIRAISKFRNLAKQAEKLIDPEDRADLLQGWSARLKFSGDWVGGPSTDIFLGGTEIPSPSKLIPRLSKPTGSHGDTEYTDRKGRKRKSRRESKRGEIYTPYVLANPGQAPNQQLLSAWLSWTTGNKLLTAGRKELSPMRKMIGRSILKGTAVSQAGGQQQVVISVPRGIHTAQVTFRLLATDSQLAKIMGPRK